MLFTIFHQRRLKLLILLPIAVLLSVVVLYAPFRSDFFDRASKLSSGIAGDPATPSGSATEPGTGPEKPDAEQPEPPALGSSPTESDPLRVPPEYNVSPARGDICAQRFSELYLQEFANHSVSYCVPESRSEITCFHNNKRADGATDSMCFGQGVGFDVEAGKFTVDCAIRDLTPEEKDRGLIRFQDIRPYWYETGPPLVFAAAVSIHAPTTAARHLADSNKARAVEEGLPDDDDAETPPVSPEAVEEEKLPPPKNFFLVKREGEANIYHCLMEIMSAWMSFDVLRMSQDSGTGLPLFDPAESSDTQAIILDDRADGPFFDLWTLFAGRKPLRLHELAKDTETIEAIENANIIVPLAGSSNPLWQDDWETGECADVPTVHVFAQRVLDFYDIQDPKPRQPEDPIVVTFIDRTGSRVLLEKDSMFDELKQRNPHIFFQSIDFGGISFKEQLGIVRETDVLVGVHGAGLTHGLFMREHAGAVVEIQPRELDVFHPFRNIALLGGQGYFRTHADSIPREKTRGLERRGDWHFNDVRIEKERLFEVIETAIKSLYGNGVWDHDIN